ncbi:hypothetical protein BAL199_01469 [alpha proteobacterium BAL199]|nr:hypothetical protein BAL199_01469 [alpha proteobacterium BAL199]
MYGGAVPTGHPERGRPVGHGGDPLGRLIGQTIAGRYEIDAVIGKRSAGVAYRAVDRFWQVGAEGHRTVTITVLDVELSKDPGALQRVLTIAGQIRDLQHPLFDPVHEVVRDADRICVITAHRIGRTLLSLMGSGPDLGWPLRTVLPIGHRIADGLSHAHRAGLFHGALGLDTVVMSADDEVHVLELGLAGALRSGGSPDGIGVRGDVFGLARIVLVLLTGASVNSQARPVRPAGLSESSWQALMHGLAGSPVGGWETPEAFMVSLEDPGWFGRLVRRRSR